MKVIKDVITQKSSTVLKWKGLQMSEHVAEHMTPEAVKTVIDGASFRLPQCTFKRSKVSNTVYTQYNTKVIRQTYTKRLRLDEETGMFLHSPHYSSSSCTSCTRFLPNIMRAHFTSGYRTLPWGYMAVEGDPKPYVYPKNLLLFGNHDGDDESPVADIADM